MIFAVTNRYTNARFWSKVDRTPGCWVWTAGIVRGAPDEPPYGAFWTPEGARRAHRWAYERLVGAIPPGLQLDHLCRNTLCVRPDHLEPVTSKVNTLRGVAPSSLNKQKTHCVHGHEFTPENTRIKTGDRRGCITCENAGARTRRAKRVATRTGSARP